MKLNYEIALIGEKVSLIPYRPEHVERYHEWMKDPDLLEATGSEPLSLDEEIAMQKSWRDDPEKCTFIVHSTAATNYEQVGSDFVVSENLEAMVGDVNLFLSEIDDDDDDDGQGETSEEKTRRLQAEVDIMVAEKDLKRKGLGRAATCSVILYGARKLKIERFFCKINEDNIASISMFKALGFVQCDYAACFKQLELELRLPLSQLEIEMDSYGSYVEVPCPQ